MSWFVMNFIPDVMLHSKDPVESIVRCRYYRDIPQKKFDKITSLEMVEHVGVKNLPKFFDQMHDLLTDDGIFFLQWTGLRRGFGDRVHDPITGLRPEDLIWGLFMNKYVF